MATFSFTSLKAAARQIAKDAVARQARVERAVLKAANKTAPIVRTDLVPKAFGELADSIHVSSGKRGQADIIADAPHAEAVEVGSRPHLPPLAPIVKWVRLRGIQGLSAKGSVKQNLRTPSTKSAQQLNTMMQRTRIAHLIHAEVGGKNNAAAKWRRNAELGAVDPATIAVAQAIRMKIAKNGTKPFRFMQAGITPAMVFLDTFVKSALEDP
jgi:hypothetical protein